MENIKKHAIFLSRDKKTDTGNVIRFSEAQASRERAQYWDYLRCMLQFVLYQTAYLEELGFDLEQEIRENDEKYMVEKKKTMRVYEYLSLL